EKNVGDRVCHIYLRLSIHDHSALKLGLIDLDKVIGHRAFVEAVERYFPAVWRPPHRSSLVKLFAVDPARDPVLDATFLVSVGGDCNFVCAACITQPEIAIAIECLELLVGRFSRGELASALESARASSAAGSALFASGRRRTDVGALTGRDVVAKRLAILVVVK